MPLEERIWRSPLIALITVSAERVLSKRTHIEYGVSVEEVLKGSSGAKKIIIVSKGDGQHQARYAVGGIYLAFLRLEEKDPRGRTQKVIDAVRGLLGKNDTRPRYVTVNRFFGNILVKGDMAHLNALGLENGESPQQDFPSYRKRIQNLIEEQKTIGDAVELGQSGFMRRHFRLEPHKDLLIKKMFASPQEYRLIGPGGYSSGKPFQQTARDNILRIERKHFYTIPGEYTIFAGSDIYHTPWSHTIRVKVK